jgi:hypothetical protein
MGRKKSNAQYYYFVKITLKTFWMIIPLICAACTAQGQTNATELKVSAKASLLLDANNPKVLLTILLINTGNKELTVLTRNLNLSVERVAGSPNHTTIEIGYADPPITYDGHALMPSLSDFSPVTLRPKEAAFIQQEVTGLSAEITKDPQFTVEYKISSDWGARFAVWHGSVTTERFTASIRQPR